MARSLVQVERAVQRNPKAPDFTGLDVIMEGHVDTSGAAVTHTFDTWVADQQRAKAQIAKQGRLLREEWEHEAKRHSNKDKGKGKGKEKGPAGSEEG